jgi:hypothetical protein
MGKNSLDPVLRLLFIGIMLFTMITIYVNHVFPNDGQMFQVICGILTGFTGAFFGRMDPKKVNPNEESKVTTKIETTVEGDKKP